MVDLDKLHATLRADIGPHILVLQEVVLQLAAVGEGLVALTALVAGGTLVAGLMPFEMSIAGEL